VTSLACHRRGQKQVVARPIWEAGMIAGSALDAGVPYAACSFVCFDNVEVLLLAD
jgi:hypothetical protein